MRIGMVFLAALLIASPALADVLVYSFPMDSDPGWQTEGDWAFGRPSGQGGQSGGPDPVGGYTGENAYAYNVHGDYPNNLAPTEWLVTEELDFTGYTDVQLRFRRWLGVEESRYENAWINVSKDGTNWTTVWHNSAG